MAENINEKIAELEEKRLAAYRKNQEIRKQIQELQNESTNLYKDEFKYQEEITKLKSDETSLYLGKFVKVRDCYIHVTSIANEYNDSICAFSGPHFYMRENGGSEGGYYISIDTGHASAHYFPPVFVHTPEEVEIITKDDFFAAYDKMVEDGRKCLSESIDLKPLGKKDNEYVYEDKREELEVYGSEEL